MTKPTFLDSELTFLPNDQIFKVNGEFYEDTNPDKMNLSIGAYTDNNGKVYVLETVKKAKKMIVEDPNDTHQYLPTTGYPGLKSVVGKLIFGDENKYSNNLGVYQALGGTGGFYIGGKFLAKFCGATDVMIPAKTWGPHNAIFKDMGFKIGHYRYDTASNGTLDVDHILEDLEKCPSKSVVVLQVCCHNPCGLDPDHQGWEKIANLLKRRELIPFLDLAYMGFGSPNMSDDVWAVHYFAEMGFEFLMSVSFSKNFGLYGERIGSLVAFLKDGSSLQALSSNVSSIVRNTYSTPGHFGAKIVLKIFGDDALYQEWKDEVSSMMKRVQKVRSLLYNALKNMGIDWPQIVNACGFFFESPLTVAQVEKLKNDWHVYILPNGRVNMAGLLEKRVDHFAKALKDVLN